MQPNSAMTLIQTSQTRMGIISAQLARFYQLLVVAKQLTHQAA